MAGQPPLVRFALRFLLGWYRFFALTWFSLVRRVTGKAGTPAEERVVSGASWDEFCDTLKAAGATILAPGAPRDAFNQAEGYRYLAPARARRARRSTRRGWWNHPDRRRRWTRDSR